MANGRLYSAYKSAGKAKSSYKASLSDIYNVGLEAQHSKGMADIDNKRTEDAIGFISEGLTLTSNLYEGHKSKEQMSKISKEMGAEVQKQSGLDWLFGAEKEYKLGDKTYTSSELKTKYKSDDYKLPKTESTKVDKTGVDTTGKKVSDKPTLAEEAGMSKKSKGFIGKHKGLDMLGGKGFLGEEKGIDTKTKDWFSNLFKGGADQGFNEDNSTRLDAPFNPDDLDKDIQDIGIVKTKSNYNPLDNLSKEDLNTWMSEHGDKSSDTKPLTQYANWLGGT